MVEPLDPVDRICHYARELFIRNIAVRKLAKLSEKIEEIAPEEKWARIIIETLIDDILIEAATDIRCKEKVRLVLNEIKKEKEEG